MSVKPSWVLNNGYLPFFFHIYCFFNFFSMAHMAHWLTLCPNSCMLLVPLVT